MALSVRGHLAILTLVIAVPLIGLAFFLTYWIPELERESTRAALLSNARALSAALDREIDKHIAVGSTISRSRLLLNGSWPEFYIQAKEALELLPDSWLTVANANGQIFLNTLSPADAQLPKRELWEAERQALATGRPVVSDLLTGVVEKRVGAFAAIPVFKNRTPLYVLDITLNPEHFRRMLEQQKFPGDWLVGIVDRNGTFVARIPDESPSRVGQEASIGWRQAISQSHDGIAEHMSLEGEPIVDAYARSAYGWTVGVAISKAILDAPAIRTRWMLAAASLGCLGLGAACAWRIAQRFDVSARRLHEATKALALEKAISPEPVPVREYNDVIEAFTKVAEVLRVRTEDRQRVQEALRASESELEAIIKRTPFMLAHCSRDFHYRFISNAYAEMIGCKAEDVIGKSLVEVIGEQGFATIRPHIEKVFRGERVEYESEVHFKSIGSRTLHVVYVPEKDAHGSVIGWIASLLDITEAKRASQAEKMLVRELQHRSHNLLAVIQAVAQRSLRGKTSLEEARNGFQARLQALAFTHKQLTNSNWTGVSLEQLVRSELAPFSTRAKINGTSIVLNPQQAQNFSLALHELATNAAKHGALSRADGEIIVSWRVTQEQSSERSLHFSWEEKGGPIASPPSKEGFGTSLLKTLFGQDCLSYPPQGLRCELRISL